jgi:tetratricopeptide (TPR) repeat protein
VARPDTLSRLKPDIPFGHDKEEETSVRSFLLSATLATTAGFTSLQAATFVQRLPVRDVELQELRSEPSAFLNTQVRFRAVYIEAPGIYDPIHTPYSAEGFTNIAVWDDEDYLFDPQVRALPLVTLYFAKKAAADSGDLVGLHKFDLVEIVGDVASTARGLPWINIQSLKKVDDAHAYNDNAIYHVEQGTALAADGAYDLADARFATALKDDLPPNGVIAINVLRARNQMTAGDDAEAAASLRSALEVAAVKSKNGEKHASNQEVANLHYLLAKSLGEVADKSEGPARTQAFEEAVTHARHGLTIDPENGDAYAVLGISLAGLGRFDEARRECAQAIRLQPNNAEVRWYLGRILDSQGDFDGAIAALKKAIDLTPKDHRIHKAIAAAYHHRATAGSTSAPEDFSTAVREYDIALRLRPDDVDSAYESAMVLRSAAEAKAEVQIGEERMVATVDHAIARLESALGIDPKHVPSLLALADIYQANGRVDDAIRILNDLIVAEPNRIEACLQLAKLQVGKGANDDAIATLEAFRAGHPKDPAILANIGRLARTIDRPEAGISALEALTAMQPKNAPAQVDLAECYLATGLPNEAVKRAKIAVKYAGEADAAAAQDCLARAQAATGR